MKLLKLKRNFLKYDFSTQNKTFPECRLFQLERDAFYVSKAYFNYNETFPFQFCEHRSFWTRNESKGETTSILNISVEILVLLHVGTDIAINLCHRLRIILLDSMQFWNLSVFVEWKLTTKQIWQTDFFISSRWNSSMFSG